MDTFLIRLKKSSYYISYPIVFLSVLLLVVNILGIFNIDMFEKIYSSISENIEMLFAPLAVSFIVCFACDNGKKGISAGISILMTDLVLYAICGVHFSLAASVLTGIILVWVFDRYDLIYAFLISLTIGVIISVFIGFVYDYLFELLKGLCSFISKKYFLLGATDNFYSLFISDNFNKMFYGKDYSGALLIDEKIVVGIKKIFVADLDNRVSATAWYLGGKYIVNIFITMGMFSALYSRLNSNEMGAMLITSLLAIVFGDIRLLSVFVLVYNPFVYLAYLALITISYITSGMLDLKIGYLRHGSLQELITYGERWVYFLLSGIVLAVMTYFVTAYVMQRLDIHSNLVLPKKIRKIVKALGGRRNIQRVSNKCIYVKNPNLIDILSLDCEVQDNQIYMRYDDIEMLKEYF